MKVHWLIPLICDAKLQFTSKNELARAFCELGNEITTTVAYLNVKTPMDGFNHVEYVHTKSGSILKKIAFDWKMIQSALASDADVIIFGVRSVYLLPLISIFGRKKKTRFIMDIRTIPVDVAPGISGRIEVWRYNLSLWLADRYCDGLTVITPMLRNTVLHKLKRLKHSIGIWTSGVNLAHFTRSGENRRTKLKLEEKQVILYHGVLSPNRGLQNMVLALNLLRNEFPDLVFLLVGEGPGRKELEALVNELKLQNRVYFVGRVPYSEVPAYVRTANLAILPFPDIEWWAVSSPIKLMEYLAAGIPIIATDIEAHRWVVNNTGGAILAENDQPESIAKAVRLSLKNPVVPADLEKLQKTISWTSQAQSLQSFLENLCK